VSEVGAATKSNACPQWQDPLSPIRRPNHRAISRSASEVAVISKFATTRPETRSYQWSVPVMAPIMSHAPPTQCIAMPNQNRGGIAERLTVENFKKMVPVDNPFATLQKQYTAISKQMNLSSPLKRFWDAICSLSPMYMASPTAILLDREMSITGVFQAVIVRSRVAGHSEITPFCASNHRSK